MSVSGILTKTIGGIGLALVAYDSHKAGQHYSSLNISEAKSGSLSRNVIEDLSSDSPSAVKLKLKKGLLHYKMDENISGFVTGPKGYFKGFSGMLVHNAIPCVLSLGTLLTKGTLSKFFGAGLLICGGMILAQEIFGLGKKKSE